MIGEVDVRVKVAESAEPHKVHRLPLVVVSRCRRSVIVKPVMAEQIQLNLHNVFQVNGAEHKHRHVQEDSGRTGEA